MPVDHTALLLLLLLLLRCSVSREVPSARASERERMPAADARRSPSDRARLGLYRVDT